MVGDITCRNIANYVCGYGFFLGPCPSEIDVSNWVDVDKLEDPELKKLAGHLPGILVQDRAKGTVNTYIQAYRRWNA